MDGGVLSAYNADAGFRFESDSRSHNTEHFSYTGIIRLDAFPGCRPGPHEKQRGGKLIVQKSSVFPASKEIVFRKLQKLETLQKIAKPYASFEPVDKMAGTWNAGSTSSYRFRLFGLIPFGTHTIHIIRFDPDGISSRECNEHVPVWNHDIKLVKLDDRHTEYTDRVEIKAGWKTIFIWLWANAFYAHRQRKWIKMLNEKN